MKDKYVLSSHEQNYIFQRSKLISDIKAVFNTVFGFNEGDYLVAFRPERSGWGDRILPKTPIVNSHGVPRKYKVLHVDEHGIPYIKELNRAGNPTGGLICPLRRQNEGFEIDEYMKFEVDPSYTDAIIFNEVDKYDAAENLMEGSATFHAIQQHNKENRVNVNCKIELLAFLQTLKVGDLLWKSVKSNFTILTIDPIPLNRKGELERHKDFGEAQDHKGKKFKLSHRTFESRAIYTKQPRSFKEISDPK